MKKIKVVVKEAIIRLTDNPKTICVALSGGADSVCLLHALKSVSCDIGFSLFAIHINHNIRGEEAKRDADFCTELCKKLCIPLKMVNINVLEQAKKGESVELAARRMRYEAFENITADYIATAHNADDSLETFLINFCRGTGLKGLTGIPDLRGRFVRPLNGCSKADILAYIKENNLEYVVDSTNLSDDYTRNKIRNNVIPLLKEISPELITVSARNLSLLKNDNDFIESEAKKLYSLAFVGDYLKAEPLITAHTSLTARVISEFVYSFTKRHPDNLHIKQMIDILNKNGSKVELYNGFYAEVKKGCFYLKKDEEIKIKVETEIILKENFAKECKINKLLLKNALDYDKIVGKLVLRTRQPGDRLSPVGRGLSKPLRRLQAECGISVDLRENSPVAADDNGVIWSYKVGTDKRTQIDENTKKVLVFKVYKTQKGGK